MAYFRSRLQIFGLLSLKKNKYNPFLWQQSWHYGKSVCSKKNIEGCNRRSISTLSKTSEHYGLRKKTCFLSIQRVLSTQKKKLTDRKLSLWEYVFGPKKSSKNPSACQLVKTTNYQEQTRFKNLRYQIASRNVTYTDLIKSKNTRFTEPQPKPPPSYKLPRAVLLNKAMVEGFPEGDRTCEGKTVTPTTPRKPYEEMKPQASNSSNTKKTTDQRQKTIRSNTKLYPPIYKKSTSRMSVIPITDSAEARDTTTKILRQAMAEEEPRMHSRIKQLKILVNEMPKSQHASQIDLGCKNSDK